MKLVKCFAALASLAALFALQTPAYAGGAKHDMDAGAYCVKKGGVVQTRIPEYGTNGSNPLVLSGSADFCQFTSADDGSQINVLLTTLVTDQPTLAALAYYAKVKLGSCTGNPGSCYCTLLGGSDLFGGVSAAGGGWVLKTDPADVLEGCIFPDLSSIDSWGLAYHSVGIKRGANLAKILGYKNPYKEARAQPAERHLPY